MPTRVLMIPFIFYLALTGSGWLAGCDTTGPPPPDGQPDTTSHNFTWQTYTLGDGASSVLYDVAIVSDTLAYAVGEIYKKDSLGNWDPNAYNLAKWNGQKWELLRIQFYTFCGQQYTGSYPARAVFAFNESEIWIASNSQIAVWNGQVQTGITCLPVSVNKIWGVRNNSVYTVGPLGQIGFYNGNTWQKIASGTDLQFLDIYGASDSKTGEQQILAVCTHNYPLGQGIFSIQGNTATRISSYPIQWELFGVWFVPNQHYYVVGDGIYEKNSLSDSTWNNGPLDITRYATTKIRANSYNDVFVVGAYGECLHWNGRSWRSYHNVTALANGSFSSVSVKGNMAIAVGADNSKAVAVIGKR